MAHHDPSKMTRWRVARIMGVSPCHVVNVVDPVHPPERVIDANGRLRVYYDRERVEPFARAWKRRRKPKVALALAAHVPMKERVSGKQSGRVARWLKLHPNATVLELCAAHNVEPEIAAQYLLAFRSGAVQIDERRLDREHKQLIAQMVEMETALNKLRLKRDESRQAREKRAKIRESAGSGA